MMLEITNRDLKTAAINIWEEWTTCRNNWEIQEKSENFKKINGNSKNKKLSTQNESIIKSRMDTGK